MASTKSTPGILEKVNFIPENVLGRKLADLSFQYLTLVRSLIFLFCFWRTFTSQAPFFYWPFSFHPLKVTVLSVTIWIWSLSLPALPQPKPYALAPSL